MSSRFAEAREFDRSGVEVAGVHPAGMSTGGGVVAGAPTSAVGMAPRMMGDRAMAGRAGTVGEMSGAPVLAAVVATVPGRGMVTGLAVARRIAVGRITVVRAERRVSHGGRSGYCGRRGWR